MDHPKFRFEASKHVKYCLRCLRMLPTPYQSEDSSRMSLAFFALSSLDLLGGLEKISEDDRSSYVDWIYAQQCPGGGFRGGPFIGLPSEMLEPAHVVMNYTALLNLAILGDDLTRLDYRALLRFVKACQTDEGSFAPFPGSKERDVRFVFCAFVICHLFDAFDTVNLEKAIDYLLRCRSYDYAFGQMPGLEPQGGTTYCVLASLHLAGRLDRLPFRYKTLDWLIHRLTPLEAHMLDGEDLRMEDDVEGERFLDALAAGDVRIAGFQGRPEKDPDACYSFWIGSSIRLLQQTDETLYDTEQEKAFLVLCQSKMGGIAKFPGDYPDVYHTYLALAALSQVGQEGLKEIDPAVNVSREALGRLRSSIEMLINTEPTPSKAL